ncbi:ABC transporter permease [Vibrio echinoideorum]|uniref:ABC transporter permease n=1 Tax=Vibrio echinoideorum TaxID=2100116 RepID=UPI003552F91B
MTSFSGSPTEVLISTIKNHGLIVTLTKREVAGRYRGSFFGLMWSFLSPLLMLAVYTFVFGEVFKARWHSESSDPGQFALMLFAGLIVFNLFSEVIMRSPGVILTNVSYVKKVVFPLEILPLTIIWSSVFHALVSIFVWLIAYMLYFGVPQLTVILAPVVLLPLIILISGFSWMLAALGVYIRDVSQLVGFLTTAMMFLSPIFFPITSLPESYRSIVFYNPLTIPIEQLRNVLFLGELPDWQVLAFYTFVACLVALVGFFFFQKTRKGFADVL